MHKTIACLMLLLGTLVVPLNASAAINADLMMSTLAVDYRGGVFNVTGSTGSGWNLGYPGRGNSYKVGAEFEFKVTVDEVIVDESWQIALGENFLTLRGNLYDPDGEGDPIAEIGPNLLEGTAIGFWYQGFTLYFSIDINGGYLADEFQDQVTLILNLEEPGTWAFDRKCFFEETTTADLQSETVPEPASLAIWATMGIGALVIRRRFRTG